MEIFTFIIFALICYRLTQLIINERGPFRVFQKIRDFMGVNDALENQEGYFAELFSCVHCMSVMMALVLWIPFLLVPWAFISILGFLAVSSLVILMSKF